MTTEFARLNASYQQWQDAGAALHAALVSAFSDPTSPALQELDELTATVDLAHADFTALARSLLAGRSDAPFDWITARSL
ncbi:hypothetical protein [Amantichitinum ursilacus]|uniref:Uncharacterized protein n=1 Tax=Amantichitinum ursilacus TaxID=857265 RepID=A0A0N0XGY8_9NEIS|nr:hypothetical protein [Amantichitinum ursilacus]KPC50399.1 hypothetical protein WG78_17365 [Amantichitinum ursilacus]